VHKALVGWSAAVVKLHCHLHLHLLDRSGRNGAHGYDPRFKVGRIESDDRYGSVFIQPPSLEWRLWLPTDHVFRLRAVIGCNKIASWTHNNNNNNNNNVSNDANETLFLVLSCESSTVKSLRVTLYRSTSTLRRSASRTSDRLYPTNDVAKMAVCSIVSSRLDHCKSATHSAHACLRPTSQSVYKTRWWLVLCWDAASSLTLHQLCLNLIHRPQWSINVLSTSWPL